jgi:YVTN family beta-propeller protein
LRLFVCKMKGRIALLVCFVSSISLFSQDSIRLKKRITAELNPKSIVHNSDGLFAVQNMSEPHNVTFFNRNFEAVAHVHDDVDLSKFDTARNSIMTWGSPTAGTFTDVGRYYWLSNYEMEGGNFTNAPCENCSGKNYDHSFIYKINTWTFKVEKVVEVGSAPKNIASSDALKIVVVSNWSSGNIHVINSKTNKIIKQIEVGKFPSGIAIHQSKKKIYVALMGEKRIAVIDMRNWQISYIENVGNALHSLALDEKKNVLFASLNAEGKVAKINLNNNAIQYLKCGKEPQNISLTSDGKFLFVINSGDNTLAKIKSDSLLLKQKVRASKKPNGLCIDEKKGEIWVTCSNGEIDIFGDKNILKRSAYEIYLASLVNKPNKKEEVYLPEIKEEEIIEKKTVPQVQTKKTNTSSTEAWIAVAGSFKSKENADKFREEIRSKGYVSEVLERENGMYLVTFGSSIHHKEIEDLVEEVKKDGMQVYITKR